MGAIMSITNSLWMRKHGRCLTCKKYNTNFGWCQTCDPHSLTQGWTSGNETLDEIIRNTQLKATAYGNYNYLQWIPYDNLKGIEKIGEGGFATIYKATWIKGDKYANKNGKFRKDRVVALKKLNESQNISDEFLSEVTFSLFF